MYYVSKLKLNEVSGLNGCLSVIIHYFLGIFSMLYPHVFCVQDHFCLDSIIARFSFMLDCNTVIWCSSACI